MTNQQLVETFLSCYQHHDHKGMQNCLDTNIQFSDFAFDIEDKEVMSMWHWFCIKYPPRKKPIEIPEFSILEETGDTLKVKYRVSYLYGDDQRPVDYFIRSRITCKNGKIIKQQDEFLSISEFEFAKQAFGFPTALLALTPVLRMIVKKKATEKLKQFMLELGI